MATGLTAGILLIGVAALASVAIVLALVLGRGRKRDWAEPMDRDPGHATDRTDYGAGAMAYPSAPTPHAAPSMSEPVRLTPEASEPTGPGDPSVPGPPVPPSQPVPPPQPMPSSPQEPGPPGQPPIPGEPPAPGAPPEPTESFQPPERRLDDTLRFKEQNRPDSPLKE